MWVITPADQNNHNKGIVFKLRDFYKRFRCFKTTALCCETFTSNANLNDY